MKTPLFTLIGLPLCLLGITMLAQTAPPATTKAPARIATYKTFAEQKTRFGYHRTRTRRYKIQRIPPAAISYGEAQTFATSSLTKAAHSASSPFYSNAQKCNGDVFAGTDRAMAKTHEVTDGVDTSFTAFDDFYSSGLLIADDQMIQHDPPIEKISESPRVAEEKFNVSIDTVYIYGIYREDDNDFHMIIGNGKTGSDRQLLNAEISGLPGDTDDSLLIAVRNKIITRFGDIACRDGAYKPVGTLIPIQIRGSVFFDIDHKAGVVGFGIYKPKTAWELHPVIGITFLDE
ncbi:MAG TPA: hypothetical protein VF939_02785 [Puia sp.]